MAESEALRQIRAFAARYMTDPDGEILLGLVRAAMGAERATAAAEIQRFADGTYERESIAWYTAGRVARLIAAPQ